MAFSLLPTDSFLIYNISITGSDICWTNSISDQESQRSYGWILQVYTENNLLAYLYHSHIGCNCGQSVTYISHLFCHQAICCTGLLSSGQGGAHIFQQRGRSLLSRSQLHPYGFLCCSYTYIWRWTRYRQCFRYGKTNLHQFAFDCIQQLLLIA